MPPGLAAYPRIVQAIMGGNCPKGGATFQAGSCGPDKMGTIYGYWALWMLSKMLTDPEKEKTQTLEQLLLRLYHLTTVRVNVGGAGQSRPVFFYPMDSPEFNLYIQEFFRPADSASAKKKERFDTHVAQISLNLSNRQKVEAIARLSQAEKIIEYNPNARYGEPLMAARTMCGQVQFAGGRLWFSQVPMKDGAFDKKRSCYWTALTTEMTNPSLETVLSTGQYVLESKSKDTLKQEKEKQVAELGAALTQQISTKLSKAAAENDMGEVDRLTKVLKKQYDVAKKLVEREKKLKKEEEEIAAAQHANRSARQTLDTIMNAPAHGEGWAANKDVWGTFTVNPTMATVSGALPPKDMSPQVAEVFAVPAQFSPMAATLVEETKGFGSYTSPPARGRGGRRAKASVEFPGLVPALTAAGVQPGQFGNPAGAVAWGL